MKKSIISTVCLLLCLALSFSLFAGCDKDGDDKLAEITQESWYEAEDSDFEQVEITGVELAELVEEALGDEAKDFDGDFSSLSRNQQKKVKEVAEEKGYTIDTSTGKTVIKKTTPADSKIKEIYSKAGVEQGTKLSKEEQSKVQQEAAKEGITVNFAENGKPEYVVPTQPETRPVRVTTTKAQKENTTKKKTPKTTISHTRIYTTAKPQTKVIDDVNTDYANCEWVETYGASSNAQFGATCRATNGTVAVGTTTSDKKGSSIGSYGALIAKYGDDGKMDWNDVLYGDGTTSFDDVTCLTDGSIVAVGTTLATDLVPAAEYKCSGTVEGVVAKYSKNGSRQWVKIVGGSRGDIIYAVEATPDGGFVVGGKSESTDGSFKNISNSGEERIKAFIIKYDSDFNMLWSTALSGSKHNSVDGLAVSGNDIYATVSVCAHDGDYAEFTQPGGMIHYCVVAKFTEAQKKGDDGKTKYGVSLRWKKNIWELGPVVLKSITMADNNESIALAGTYSGKTEGNKGTFSNLYTGGVNGTTDGAFVRMNLDGEIMQVKSIVGFESDNVSCITAIPGGFAITAYTTSTNRDFPEENKGGFDCYTFITTLTGKIKTYSKFSGSLSDRAMSVCSDGENIYVVGGTNSSDIYFAKCSAKGDEGKCVGFITKMALVDAN